MHHGLPSEMEDNPIIAAVKDDQGLQQALETDCKVIFLLYGNVCSIASLVDRVKSTGKMAYVHADLIDGLASREVAVTFIKTTTHANGIISTKPAIVKAAKEQGLVTVQRFFLLDSLALSNFKKYVDAGWADMIEVMPATMPKIIRRISQMSHVPIIAGGLISDKEDVMLALQNGAAAVSTTNQDVWRM